MKRSFRGVDPATGNWRKCAAEVVDEDEFIKLCRLQSNGTAAIEAISYWEDSNQPTGAMVNFCINHTCGICEDI